jgi:hypothetical protein
MFETSLLWNRSGADVGISGQTLGRRVNRDATGRPSRKLTTSSASSRSNWPTRSAVAALVAPLQGCVKGTTDVSISSPLDPPTRPMRKERWWTCASRASEPTWRAGAGRTRRR